MGRITIESCDENWTATQPQQRTGAKLINKLLSVEMMSIYWNDLVIDPLASGKKGWSEIMSPSNFMETVNSSQFIIPPCSLRVKCVHVNKRTDKVKEAMLSVLVEGTYSCIYSYIHTYIHTYIFTDVPSSPYICMYRFYVERED